MTSFFLFVFDHLAGLIFFCWLVLTVGKIFMELGTFEIFFGSRNMNLRWKLQIAQIWICFDFCRKFVNSYIKKVLVQIFIEMWKFNEFLENFGSKFCNGHFEFRNFDLKFKQWSRRLNNTELYINRTYL